MALGHGCPNLTLETGLSVMPNQRCPLIMVPATPSFIRTAAVMKSSTTTTNKPCKRVWSLLQGDRFFVKEEITEMHAVLLPYISK